MTGPRPVSQQSQEFFGPAYKMDSGDWRLAAFRLGCDPAAIRAAAEQESGGRRGFLPDTRPLILFEAHWFGRFTKHRYDRTHPTISAPAWDRSLYRGGAEEYDRLHAAMRLDRRAALMSASWGMFQIMGFNHEEAGHGDVEAYVQSMCYSEGKHLQAFASLVVRNGRMARAIRGHDWATFARYYNGPQYRANHYHIRMAEHYRRFLGDTTYLMGEPQRAGKAAP